ncbi:tlde1 domain-containing protein [Methylobacterium nigriterrae]|uniref:tlde1 domain-containing protein n=1 Tax=Methylobacterium nigriterrae TaxID=3127512 RepID=UPI003013D390
MAQTLLQIGGLATRARRIGGQVGGTGRAPLTVALAAFLTLAPPDELSVPRDVPAAALVTEDPPPAPAQQGAEAPGAGETPDAAPSLGPDALQAWRSALLGAIPDWPAAPPDDAAGPSASFARQEPAPPASSPDPETAPAARIVPLPVPRPRDLRSPAAQEPARRASRQAASAAAPPAPEDTRSFFEKLFGVERSAGPALAYAALESKPIEAPPRRQISPVPFPDSGGGTAVYDITARTVTLPSGERLEAHSGLGASMDDPRSVHVRMRGATPPGTYDLTEREALFHGVRAIRLTPVGGSEAVHGRVGLLAHTYMLGPSGASNGCVSFRDYNRFLQAYLRGEVRRLVVVAGSGDALPRFASRLFGRSE